jgi:hypothetical protein
LAERLHFGGLFYLAGLGTHSESGSDEKIFRSNLDYFRLVMDHFLKKLMMKISVSRKNAIIDLANLSDNFQRMISDPKNQQRKLETVHQFVTTTFDNGLQLLYLNMQNPGMSFRKSIFRIGNLKFLRN